MDALWRATGGPLPWEELWDREEQGGAAALTLTEQHLLRADMYGSEVDNGGHSQYFINSSGGNWRLALAGLNAAGALKHAELLQSAVDLFGEDGPPEDYSERGEAMDRLSSELMPALDELDTRFYELTDSLAAKIALYYLNQVRK